jgi:hypothetical protein
MQTNIIESIIDGIFKFATLGVRGVSEELSKKKPAWRYSELKKNPMLYSSDYLMQLTRSAIREENLYSINELISYIEKHKVEDLGGYADCYDRLHEAMKKLNRRRNRHVSHNR